MSNANRGSVEVIGQTTDATTTANPAPEAAKPPTVRLDHFLKRAALVSTGGNAKQDIQGGLVRVNGEVEQRRRRQLREGDVVRYGERESVVGKITPRDAAASEAGEDG